MNNRAIATGKAVRDFSPVRVLQELEAAIGFHNGYVIPLGKTQDAWLYRLLVDTVLFHTGGDNGPRPKTHPAPKTGSSPVNLAAAAMESGRSLASSMLMPAILQVRQAQGIDAANNLAIGAICQLAATLSNHVGPKRAAEMLAAISLATAKEGGH